MKRPDGKGVICDVCLRVNQNWPDDDTGFWHKRGERDVCPRCAYLVNRALAVGIIEGQMFDIDSIVLVRE